MSMMPLKLTARLLGTLILAAMLFQPHPQAARAAAVKAETAPSLITMPSYSLVSPFGKEWQFDSDER